MALYSAWPSPSVCPRSTSLLQVLLRGVERALALGSEDPGLQSGLPLSHLTVTEAVGAQAASCVVPDSAFPQSRRVGHPRSRYNERFPAWRLPQASPSGTSSSQAFPTP